MISDCYLISVEYSFLSAAIISAKSGLVEDKHEKNRYFLYESVILWYKLFAGFQTENSNPFGWQVISERYFLLNPNHIKPPVTRSKRLYTKASPTHYPIQKSLAYERTRDQNIN